MEILVHVDQTLQAKARIEVAVAFARRMQARLIGVALIQDLDLGVALSDSQYVRICEMIAAVKERDMDRAVAEFRNAVVDSGLPYEVRKDSGPVAERLAVHARYADVTLIGQSNPDCDLFDSLDHALPLIAGGPVLVVPFLGSFPVIGERPLIAWNGSREAARAVKDAMPILQRAERVDVLVLSTERMKTGAAEKSLHELTGFLESHGVTAIGNCLSAEDAEVGEILLSRTADLGSDLLVMGAYGRSRFRETVLGGATRSVLRSTPVPVLLSH